MVTDYHRSRDAGWQNTVKIPYKIDTGSKGNLMPLYLFKKLCGHWSVEQLKRSIKTT